MKKIFTLTLFLFFIFIHYCLPTFAQDNQGQSTTQAQRTFKHDGKITLNTIKEGGRQTTFVILNEMPVDYPKDKKVALKMYARYYYSGKVPRLPENPAISFISKKPIFPEEPEVVITFDGKSILITSQFTTDKNKRGIGWAKRQRNLAVGIDELYLEIPLDDLVQIINAQNVTVRVKSVEFQLTENHRQALADFISRGMP